MDFDLTPKFGQKIFEGDGGSYHSWSASEFPLLAEAKVSGGTLVLKPDGFAFPHYTDCSKVGYVLQGEATVGLILPNTSKEVLLPLAKGFVIPVSIGSVSWWLNAGDSDFVIVFVGETSRAYAPGKFTYFLLAGALGPLAGFSAEFTSRALNMEEKKAASIASNQRGSLIIKVPHEAAKSVAQQCREDSRSLDKFIKNIEASLPDASVEGGGSSTTLTGAKFPFLEDDGLSCRLTKLEPNAMVSPYYTSDSTIEAIYVAKGSGKVQIVGLNGERALDTEVKAGQLIVVPRFFVFAMIAGGEGALCFSIIPTPKPAIEGLVRKESAINAISPTVLQFSLDVPKELIDELKSKMAETSLVISPP